MLLDLFLGPSKWSIFQFEAQNSHHKWVHSTSISLLHGMEVVSCISCICSHLQKSVCSMETTKKHQNTFPK